MSITTGPTTGDKPHVLNGSRVLLAEDCPDTQLMISFLLEDEGAEVTTAANGQECFDIAQKANTDGQPFDLILMDIQMPIMDGLQATKLLRSTGYKLPIVALTARCGILDVEKTIESGCDEHISKLVGRDNIVSTVERFLVDREESHSNKPVKKSYEAPMLPIYSPIVDREPAYASIVLKFVDQLEDCVELVGSYIEQDDYAATKEQLAVMSNADLFGYALLSKLVQEMESQIEEEKYEKLPDSYHELQRVAARIGLGREHILKRLRSH